MKYMITLSRTASRTKDIEVEAKTATEAVAIAKERAPNEDFPANEKEAEYDVIDINPA